MTVLPALDEPACAPAPAQHAMGADVADRVAAMLKALADPLRLRMLSIVAGSPTAEACVCDLATVADVSQPTVSHHLKVLKDVGVLTSQRRGTWVYYRVAPGAERAVRSLLESFAPVAAVDNVPTPEHRDDDSGLRGTQAALQRIAERLTARSGLDPQRVTWTVRDSYAALARTARVTRHLTVLTERFAAQRLEDLARSSDASHRVGDRRPRVLFVCVANAGRSQLAAALLRRYAGDAVVVRSAGSSPASEVHATVRPVLVEVLGDVADDDVPFPKPLTDEAVRAADVVVTMGCGDTCPVLPGTRYEDWAVGDPALASPEGLRAIRDEIDRRVRALLADLLPQEAHRG